MKKHEEILIMQDEDISVYERKLIDYVPNHMKLGGYITVVNNHNGEKRWKEWRWFQYDNGQMFNDKAYVIDMLSDLARGL